MTRIRSNCPMCGEQDLRPPDVTLQEVRPDTWEYFFTCPECSDEVRKPADERIRQLLTNGGVATISHPRRAVPTIPLAQFPPFTHDDLLDFHQLLADSEKFFYWFAQLAAFVEMQGSDT